MGSRLTGVPRYRGATITFSQCLNPYTSSRYHVSWIVWLRFGHIYPYSLNEKRISIIEVAEDKSVHNFEN